MHRLNDEWEGRLVRHIKPVENSMMKQQRFMNFSIYLHSWDMIVMNQWPSFITMLVCFLPLFYLL